ncbi:uncharacterized protein TRIADDRAFT_59819 [Trichoplax adhaerens]|uniref:ATP receptor n=1 Tax=Trichoplax adhaerens TaxID=10228 RepID=B3S6I7_TRIAD|nr:hypothetical protein TRIADDRAFT_59819 [Trichoplax adhaerens]EDV21626.1 hypothetical protein TRIADDRAFT_59819 [Trichoplax adhaerens]|eukprot:XP_002115774.1 hypothetical protein TRIADDRAFT_59819 [Trichoplax adhaerens]
MENCCNRFADLALDYNTPKIIHIKSKVVGFINRFIQLAIVGYIIGYVLVYKKGYQEFDTAQNSVTSKVKGVAFVNYTKDPNIGTRVWDPADYIIPPEENGAFFVMTNMIITKNQTNTVCPEDMSIRGANCTDSTDCIPGKHLYLGHGVNTGECVPVSPDSDEMTCEIYSWCPLEYDHLRTNYPFLGEAVNFTVLIKNSIAFPKFNVRRSNIDAVKNSEDLKHCMYDPVHDALCPILKLGTIVNSAEQDFNKIAYKVNNKLHRDLIKAYGIRFVFIIVGRAGRFSVVPLLLNIGSGLALLAIASVISDVVILYVLKRRQYYRSKKYQTVSPFDDDSPLLQEDVE